MNLTVAAIDFEATRHANASSRQRREVEYTVALVNLVVDDANRAMWKAWAASWKCCPDRDALLRTWGTT